MGVRLVGRDRVEQHGDRLTIVSAAGPMPGWDVRRYRAPVIKFEGRTWRITARTAGPGNTTRYDLEAWQPNHGEVPGPEIEYSVDFVMFRDHALNIGEKRSRASGVLGFAPIRWLTGFLWSRTKDHLETVYGIDPVASTRVSAIIEAIVAISTFSVSSIARVVGAFGYDSGFSIKWMFWIGVVAAIDAAVRWSRLLDEERPAPGFYEWILRRK